MKVKNGYYEVILQAFTLCLVHISPLPHGIRKKFSTLFLWANQRKPDIKSFSWTQCEISKDRRDWHILAGNDWRIASLNLNRVHYKIAVGNFFSENAGNSLKIFRNCPIARHKLIMNLSHTSETKGSFTLCVFFWLRLRFPLSQQIGCTGLNGSVHSMRFWQPQQLLYSPLWAKTNRSCKSHSVNGP